MLKLNKIQDYQRKPGSMEVRLVATNPAMRLKVKDEPPVWVQGGKFYPDGESTQELPEVPAWVHEELKRISPAARRECGLDAPVTAVVTPPIGVGWVCPTCDETVPTRQKGVHIARHRKVEKAGSV